MSDTHIEGLEEIVERLLGCPGANTVKFLKEQFLADPAILAHIPAYKALQEEVELCGAERRILSDKFDAVFNENTELRARIATLEATNAAQAEQLARLKDDLQLSAEMRHEAEYQIEFAVKQAIELALNCYSPDDTVTDYQYKIRALLQSSTPAESQLAGGKAVGVVVGFDAESGLALVDHACEGNTRDLEVGDQLYTEAPAIKQQVAKVSSAPKRAASLSFEGGSIRINLEGYRHNGGGCFAFDSKDIDWEDECCVVKVSPTEFVEIQKWLNATLPTLSAAPTHPVSANQPDGGKEGRLEIACSEFRDSILHENGPLEINDVLHRFDATIGEFLFVPKASAERG